MKTILDSILIIHIACGFTALLTGLVSIVAKKGSYFHTRAGVIYYWMMAIVCLTALMRFKMEFKLIFLTSIAIFSFYTVFSGRRILKFKKPTFKAERIDWCIAILALVCGIFMTFLGLKNIFLSLFGNQKTLVGGILFTVFGTTCMLLPIRDMLFFAGKLANEPMKWFFNHITRMMGSYAATVTAFCVTNNNGRFNDLIVWILPGVIFGVLGETWVFYYRKKFDKSRKFDSQKHENVLV